MLYYIQKCEDDVKGYMTTDVNQIIKWSKESNSQVAAKINAKISERYGSWLNYYVAVYTNDGTGFDGHAHVGNGLFLYRQGPNKDRNVAVLFAKKISSPTPNCVERQPIIDYLHDDETGNDCEDMVLRIKQKLSDFGVSYYGVSVVAATKIVPSSMQTRTVNVDLQILPEPGCSGCTSNDGQLVQWFLIPASCEKCDDRKYYALIGATDNTLLRGKCTDLPNKQGKLITMNKKKSRL